MGSVVLGSSGSLQRGQSNSPLADSHLDQAARDFVAYLKRIDPYQSNDEFCAYVEQISSFQDLSTLFEPAGIDQHFTESSARLKGALLKLIIGIEDDDQRDVQCKFLLARRVIQIAQEHRDSGLAASVVSTLLAMSHDGDTPRTHKIMFRDEVINIFRDPEILGGYDALALLPLVLSANMHLNAFVEIFEPDDELLRSILRRAYQSDVETAHRCCALLVTHLDMLETTGILYPNQLERFARLPRKIEALDREIFALSGELKATALKSAQQSPELSTVLAPSVPGLVVPQHDPHDCLTQLAMILHVKIDDDVLFARNKIDTSEFPMSLVDIAEGVEKMCEFLAEQSPLRIKLEAFYQRLPKLAARFEPQVIKADLISVVKPELDGLDPFDFFGNELGTLKLACTSLYWTLWNHREPTCGTEGRRRSELPQVVWFFAEGTVTEDGERFRDRVRLVNYVFDHYESGEYSFGQVANALAGHFSAGHRLPLREYARQFVIDFLPEAHQFEPDFTVTLESSHDNLALVESLREFAIQQERSSPEYRVATEYVVRFCDEYLSGRLNDQSFLQRIDRATSALFRDGDFRLSSQIYEILGGFTQQFRT